MRDDLKIWTTVGSAGTLSAADLAKVGRFHYVLQVTYKGTARARLGQFNVLTGADSDVLHFDSASFPPAHMFATNSGSTADDSAVLDFVNCAYCVEATLTASAVVAGNPAAIGAVKVFASPDFSG